MRSWHYIWEVLIKTWAKDLVNVWDTFRTCNFPCVILKYWFFVIFVKLSLLADSFIFWYSPFSNCDFHTSLKVTWLVLYITSSYHIILNNKKLRYFTLIIQWLMLPLYVLPRMLESLAKLSNILGLIVTLKTITQFSKFWRKTLWHWDFN